MLFRYLNTLFSNLIYDIIYSFSSVQIKMNKMQNYFIKNDVKKHTHEFYVELYNDGILIKRMHMMDYLKHWETEQGTFNYMIVVNEDSNVKQKLKITNKKCNDGHKFELSWKKSTAKFVSITLSVENETNVSEYPINLMSKTENYLIVGNRIDREFIKYYLLKHHNKHMTDYTYYTLQIFDNMAKYREIKYPEGLEITENGYRIIQ